MVCSFTPCFAAFFPPALVATLDIVFVVPLCRTSLHCHISLGRAVWCQHGAFSGVGAFVVSFVPTECPVGGGMWGIFGKPLKKGFSEMYGLGGGSGTIFFFRKLAVTVDRLGLFCLF